MIFFKHYYPVKVAAWYNLISKTLISQFWPPKSIKLAVIFTFIFCIRVSAFVNAQQINLSLKDVSLETAFSEIEKQTDYGFWYDKNELANAPKVSVNVKNGTVKQVLDLCLKDQAFSYEIFDKTIVIKRKAKKSQNLNNINFQDQTIKGKVSDDKGLPLSGVSVRLLGADRAVKTDENGQFTIIVPNEYAILQFTYLGFTDAEYKVGKETFLTVILKEEPSTLKSIEVINVGYYKVEDRERTGSISKITSETIEKQPINNPLMALQGRTSGMEITQLTGVPGGGFNVQIRGRNSINTAVGNDPLYVIDGVPYPSNKISSNTSNDILSNSGASPLSFINPYDIESIEVLKDADATAIYGSRGANGVVLITTNNGKKGSPKINMTINQGFSMVGHRVDLLNTQEYIQMRQEAFKNAGTTPTNRDYDVNGSWDLNKYTDWQKELIGGNANTTNAMFNISGGNENNSYLLGANYYSEGTVFPGKLGMDRAGLHFGLNIGSAKNRLTGSFLANYNHIQSNLLRSDLTNSILLPPNAPDPYDKYGKLNWGNNTVYSNPMAKLLLTNNSSTDNLIGNLNLNYRLIENLIFKISIGYTNLKRTELAKTPLLSRSTAQTSTSTNRISDFSNNLNNSLIAEPQITYSYILGKGKLDALLGTSFQNSESEIRTIRATGFNSDDLMDNIGSAATLTSQQIVNLKYRYNSIFGRLNYNLSGKYIINLTARRDGSSKFGEGKRFANFGAIGAAWIFSDEKFIKDKLSFLSFGKLRASYGITGNDQIPDYGYLQLWTSSGSYQGISTIYPNRIANPDFGWETNKKAEAALQVGLAKDRITLEIAHYQNLSSNQLVGYPLPLSTGNSNIIMNLPATVKNTGWEFSSNFRLISKNQFQWSTSINLTIPKNKLVSYPGGIENSPYYLDYIIGQPLSIRKIYNVIGINSTTGLYDIEDKNGNGSIDNGDRYLSKFVGQYYYGGINNSINFKGFSLDFLFSFNKQNGLSYMNGSFNPGFFDYINPINNQVSFVLNNKNVQRPNNTNAAFTQYLNAREYGGEYIVDASYIRLKNVSISYEIPKQWLNAAKITSAKISFQGQNLFTWTDYVGLDPESQAFQRLPPLRALTLGLNLSF